MKAPTGVGHLTRRERELDRDYNERTSNSENRIVMHTGFKYHLSSYRNQTGVRLVSVVGDRLKEESRVVASAPRSEYVKLWNCFLTNYHQIITQILEEYSNFPYAHGNLERKFIIGEDHKNYLLLTVGYLRGKRVHDCVTMHLIIIL